MKGDGSKEMFQQHLSFYHFYLFGFILSASNCVCQLSRGHGNLFLVFVLPNFLLLQLVLIAIQLLFLCFYPLGVKLLIVVLIVDPLQFWHFWRNCPSLSNPKMTCLYWLKRHRSVMSFTLLRNSCHSRYVP